MRPFFIFFKKQGRRIERGRLPPLRNSGPVQPTRNGAMIIFSAVKLKDLFKKERNYPWQKPDSCPCCNSCRLWGHGFAEAIFDGFIRPLLLKLYRCPDCGCVIRLRPKAPMATSKSPTCGRVKIPHLWPGQNPPPEVRSYPLSDRAK